VLAYMQPDLPTVEQETREVFDRYIAKMRSAPNSGWQCGLCEKDPLHPREVTHCEVWEPKVYTGTESYADNVEVSA
jgi:hypothetical protein